MVNICTAWAFQSLHLGFLMYLHVCHIYVSLDVVICAIYDNICSERMFTWASQVSELNGYVDGLLRYEPACLDV